MPIATTAERAQTGEIIVTIQDTKKPEATVSVLLTITEWESLQGKVNAVIDSAQRGTFSEMKDLRTIYPDQIFTARPKGLMIEFNPFGSVRPRIALASAGGRLRKFFDEFREQTGKVLGGVMRAWTDEEVAEVHSITVQDPLADDEPGELAQASADRHELPDASPTTKGVVDPDGAPALYDPEDLRGYPTADSVVDPDGA